MDDQVISGTLVIDREHESGGFVLTLYGELDLASAPLLEGEIEDAQAAGEKRLVIDLSGLEFMDSAGLCLLVKAHKASLANGHRLSLLRGPRAVHRVFELTQTASLFSFND